MFAWAAYVAYMCPYVAAGPWGYRWHTTETDNSSAMAAEGDGRQ